MLIQIEATAWAAFGTIVAAFIGSYLGGYFKRKGENLATHEDIDKLVTQVSAVTHATKEIEAKISAQVWDRQRQWELKRDVLFEAARRISSVSDALMFLESTMQAERKNPQNNSAEWMQTKIAQHAAWFKASGALNETRLLVDGVCGSEVADSLNEYGRLTTTIAFEINSGDEESYAKALGELHAVRRAYETLFGGN